MSNGDDDIIIICGGVGQVERWAQLQDGHEVDIPVYSRAFVNVILDKKGLDRRTVERAQKEIERFRHRFYKIVAQPGEDIHYSKPCKPEDDG